MTRRELLALLAASAPELGGRGCIVRKGRTIKTWGDQAERRDVLSSAKPVMTTLLFFAMQESGPYRGLVSRALRGTGGFRWKVNEEIGQSSQRRDNHHHHVRAELEDLWGKVWLDP